MSMKTVIILGVLLVLSVRAQYEGLDEVDLAPEDKLEIVPENGKIAGGYVL